VIFLWQGRNVYDVSTFEALGIELDESGSPYIVENDCNRSLPNVVLVATTKRVEQDLKEEKERLANEEQQRLEEEDIAKEDLPKEISYKIILRSKDQDDHKLIVKKDTTIQRIITNFRTQKAIPLDKQISIIFEGDVLNPNDIVEDTDLVEWDSDDPMLLDVSIK